MYPDVYDMPRTMRPVCAGSSWRGYDYLPFGEYAASHMVVSVEQRYGFTGREADVADPFMYYRYRAYDPRAGRFLGRDPIWRSQGDRQYVYVRSRAPQSIDPFGLRGVTINIYYNWQDSDLTDAIAEEVDRILQDCLCTCIPKVDGKPKHTVTIEWIETEATTLSELEEEGHEYGWIGTSWGFNPTEVGVLSTDDLASNPLPIAPTATGYTPGCGWHFLTNPDMIYQSAGADQYEEGIAQTIGHEMFHHSIGGESGHYYDEHDNAEYIDAEVGTIGTTLSEEACEELCDELDVDE